MEINHQLTLRISLFLCSLSLLMGAFGWHFFQKRIPIESMSIFEMANRYTFYHALTITFLTLLPEKFNRKILDLSIILFFAGILFFSGSLYAVSTKTIWATASFNFFEAFTPFGGIFLLTGWILLTFLGIKESDEVIKRHSSRSRKKRRNSLTNESEKV